MLLHLILHLKTRTSSPAYNMRTHFNQSIDRRNIHLNIPLSACIPFRCSDFIPKAKEVQCILAGYTKSPIGVNLSWHGGLSPYVMKWSCYWARFQPPVTMYLVRKDLFVSLKTGLIYLSLTWYSIYLGSNNLSAQYWYCLICTWVIGVSVWTNMIAFTNTSGW